MQVLCQTEFLPKNLQNLSKFPLILINLNIADKKTSFYSLFNLNRRLLFYLEFIIFAKTNNLICAMRKQKTFILKWNPEISSVRTDLWHFWKKHQNFVEANWSVWDYKKAQVGDRFFMVKVGNGVTGIVMEGSFASKPVLGEDWSGKGRKVYYCDLDINYIMDPEIDPIISTDDLTEAIPNFDWTKGHSGEILENEDADKLDELFKNFLEDNKNFDFANQVNLGMALDWNCIDSIPGMHEWLKTISKVSDYTEDFACNEEVYHDAVMTRFSMSRSNVCKFHLKTQYAEMDICAKGLMLLEAHVHRYSWIRSEFSLGLSEPGIFRIDLSDIVLYCTTVEFKNIKPVLMDEQ